MRYFILFLIFVTINACKQERSLDIKSKESVSTETRINLSPPNETDSDLDELMLDEAENTETIPSQNAKLLTTSRVFKRGFTNQGMGFLLTVKNGEQSNIVVESNGLKNKFKKEYSIEAQLVDAYFLDLDGDTYMELYLITRPTDDSGNLEIMGVRSNQMDSASELEVSQIQQIRKMNSDHVFTKDGNLFHRLETSNGEVNFKYSLTGKLLKPTKLN